MVSEKCVLSFWFWHLFFPFDLQYSLFPAHCQTKPTMIVLDVSSARLKKWIITNSVMCLLMYGLQRKKILDFCPSPSEYPQKEENFTKKTDSPLSNKSQRESIFLIFLCAMWYLSFIGLRCTVLWRLQLTLAGIVSVTQSALAPNQSRNKNVRSLN